MVGLENKIKNSQKGKQREVIRPVSFDRKKSYGKRYRSKRTDFNTIDDNLPAGRD